jgi:hypothetical protein
MKTRSTRPFQSCSGSVLITALIFSVIVGIALTSYVALGVNALKLSSRSFLSTAAMNVAEAGLEQVLWSFNQTNEGSTSAWSAWSPGASSTDVRKTFAFPAGTLLHNASAVVKVYVANYNPGSTSVTPVAVAKAIVTSGDGGAPITKILQIKLTKRSLFATGLVAKNSITFSGNNASVDSWNSLPTGASTPVPYSASVRSDKGSVGSVSVSVSAITVGNADIYGSASVGGTANTPNVGPNGSILGADSPGGVKIDTTRIYYDFTANLDTPAVPTTPVYTSISSISGNMTLPRSGDTTNADGIYYYKLYDIGLSGSKNLIISGNVVLDVTAGAGSGAISVSGNSGISIARDASLVIYTAGDVSIAGNGVTNLNAQPVSFQVWGTGTSSTNQNIGVAGNGSLTGIVYAPNAAVKINGNGDLMGSVVGDTVNLTGNAAFHYDESLTTFGQNAPYGIGEWRELISASERNTYAAELDF